MFMVNKQMMHCLSVMADTDDKELNASKDFTIMQKYFYFYSFSTTAVLQEEYKKFNDGRIFINFSIVRFRLCKVMASF